MFKHLKFAAIIIGALALAGCSAGPRAYAGGPAIGGGRLISSNDHQTTGCQHGRPVTTPGGRTACVEHITDRRFLHQPEFNKAGQRAALCGGKRGQIVRINLGEGLVGNYRC